MAARCASMNDSVDVTLDAGGDFGLRTGLFSGGHARRSQLLAIEVRAFVDVRELGAVADIVERYLLLPRA